MDKTFIDDLEQWLACLVHDPSDAIALAQMQAPFEALLAGPDAGEVGQLPRAIHNLLQRLAEGTVAPNMAAIELLVEACSVLPKVDSASALELTERLDAFASGLGDVPIVAAEPAPARAPEPPLLTVREDGSHVVPGAFDSEPSGWDAEDESSPVEALPVAALEAERPPVGPPAAPAPPAAATPSEVVAALAPAVDRLGSQVGTLELLAGAELKRLASDLSASAAEIAQLKDALVDWAERDQSA